MAKFGFTSVISADWSPLNNAIKEIDRESKKLNDELATINKALKFDPDNAVLAAQKLEVMGDSAKEAEKKLEVLRSQQEAMNKALEKGDISSDYYRQYQREIEKTQKVIVDYSKAIEDNSKAQKDCKKATDNTDKSVANWSETMKGILASKAVTVLADGLKQAAESLVELGKKSVDAYGELEQNLGGAEAVFGKYANSIKSSAEDAYRVMGTSQSEYLAAANKMGALFQGSGLDQQRSLELTTQAMQRAADMASVMGIETSAALEAVTGAAKGNYTMMDNLGVAMNATTLSAYAMSKGLDVTWESASNAEKAEIAMKYFFENTEQYAGNFEREARETVSGSIGLLTASVESLMAGLGNPEADVINLTQNVIDAFNAVADNVTPVLDTIAQALPQVADSLVDAVPDILPELADSALMIVETLIKGLTDNLPEMTETAVTLITDLAQTIVDCLPEISEAAVQIVLALVNGISQALPELVPSAVEAVMSVVQVLADNVNLIVDAGINLIGGLAEGLIKALPELGKAIPQLIISLNTAIIAAIPQLLTVVPEIAKSFGEAASEINWSETSDQMIKGIVDGLTDGLGRIKEACRRLMEAIKGMLGFDNDDGHTSGSFGGVTAEDISAGSGIKELQDSLWDEADAVEEAVTEYGKMSKSAAEFMAETARGNAEVIKKTEKQAAEDAKKAREEAWGAVVSSLDDLDGELAKHNLSEGEYWEKRKALLEENRDEESEEWWKYYDEVTAYYNKLAETESKERDAALKEQTADAKERFDALYKELSDEEITRKEFNDRYAALTEELANKRIDISEYAADKIADYDKKVREEELSAWEKSSKEITSNITKTYENVTKAYEKAKSQLISSASLIEDKVTDTSGADRYILTDFEQKRRELAKYRKSLERLKDTGISDELMEQVMSLSYDNGDRQGYISELLKMSDKQRQAYYKDVEAYYAEAEASARDEVQPELDEADRIAQEGIDKIYGDMPEGAYQKGVDTALAYIEGINDAMSDAGSLMSMGSDYGERSNNAKLQSAAKDMKEIAAYASGGGNYYSENTVISVSVAGKEIIKSTLKELARSKQLADGR